METEFEKLGVFYLGRKYDLTAHKPARDLVLYDSKDLVTHAVCIGMTGSGKTGLCLGIVEEAAIDAIPVIAIDVKGDLTNLLLNFPEMRGSDLLPWLDQQQARQASMSPEEFADQRAEAIKKDLASSDQSLARIQKLRESSDIVLFTPGSSAGTSVSAMKSFEAPPEEVLEDSDLMRERIGSAVSSVLVLLDIDADPLQSREHILLSNILKSVWQEGKSIEITDLVHLIQKPPLTRIGAIDLDSIFPAKERFEFAMKLNNLLASPGFEVWMQGVPLEIDSILYGENGKPRTSIFYIAHLNDRERMFFVTLLLNRVVAWMRAQSGTSSLRALLYMDEIFGYFPPVANPPSKQPLLTLLKQARAFGLGVLLATQNPVDIDYKGLSNAGTWFIGRLQTERDKARVLDGLEGAATASGAQFKRNQIDMVLSSLGNRVFLMNNVHDDGPVLFQTRATLSYLAGPLTLEQIKKLRKAKIGVGSGAKEQSATKEVRNEVEEQEAGQGHKQKPATGKTATAAESGMPLVSPDIKTCFLPVRSVKPQNAQLVYVPHVIGVGNVRFVDTKAAIDTTLQYCILGTISGAVSHLDWQKSQPAKVWMEDLEDVPQPGAIFETLPGEMNNAKSYGTWMKEFSTWLFAAKSVKVFKSDVTGEISKARESERDFRIRISQASREQRDAAAEALKARWAPKLTALQDRIHRAQQVVQREQAQAREQQLNSAVNIGATVLGAFIGNRRVGVGTIGRASTAARSMGRSAKEQQDVAHAQDTLEKLEQQGVELDAAFAAEMSALEIKFDPANTKLTELTISPKKTNISIPLLALAWAPFWRTQSGEMRSAWSRTEVAP